MKSLWHECLLDDVLEFKNGKSLSNACYLEKAKYPVWGSNGIIAYCDKYLNNESVIVIGRVGAYCGSLNLVDGANWVTDNAIYAVPKLGNDIKFLYYLLVSLDIPRTAIGSAQPLLTQSGLKAIECKIPPLETQKEIAHILGTLDDMIELNRRMNKILEEIAQTLYKNWFIDFEFPNAEGNPYKSLGGEMVDSELGSIPKGWSVGNLTEVCKIEYGKSLSKSELADCGYPVYGGNGIIGYLPDYQYEESQLIISCRGAASGKVIITNPKSTVSHNSLVVLPKPGLEYLRSYMMSLFLNTDLATYVSGSAQPQITIDGLSTHKIVIPDNRLCIEYTLTYNDLRRMIINNDDAVKKYSILKFELLENLFG